MKSESLLEPVFFSPPPSKWDRRLYKDSPSPPAAPDPYATASAQTGQNQATAYFNAQLNRPTEITPLGSRTWTQTGGGPQYNYDAYNQAMQAWQSAPQMVPTYGTGADGSSSEQTGWTTGRGAAPTLDQFKIGDSPGQWTSTISLSPQAQRIFDTQMSTKEQLGQLGADQVGRIQSSVAKPYDLSAVAAMPTADAATRDKVEQALMDRMQPYIDRDRAALENRLANQGFADTGASGYRSSMDTFNKGVNDARMAAILNAGQEQSRLFNLGMAAHQQGISDYERQRYAPLNEYNAFQTGSQIGMPSFGANQPLASSPANFGQYAQNAYTGAQDAYNQQVATNNANTGAAASVASAAILAAMMSDRRLKTNVRLIGEFKGMGVYRFRYLEDPRERVGLMADEVQKVMPEAIVQHPTGYSMVDYGRVLA